MSSNRRFWCIALLIFASVVGIHLLPRDQETTLPKPLASLPLAVGVWNGVEMPFDDSIVKALAVDEYLNRIYRDENNQSVGLYIGYVKSQRTNENLHSPQNCLPGAGWQPVSVDQLQLTSPGGRTWLVKRYVVQKGLSRQIVLYWYQSHGRTMASEYKVRAAMVTDAILLHRTDAALVRINTPVTGTESSDRAAAFATLVLGELDGLIPR
jgi:EpsI family protein